MRVIAGTAKGIRLWGAPDTGRTRPLTDRAKEGLFNILSPRVPESRFLDLFAGTGAVGIEALSRGAAKATFVEVDRGILTVLEKNLAKTRLQNLARVVACDAFRFIETNREPYDLIFVGPPQYKGLYRRSVTALDAFGDWIPEGGLVILQCDASEYEAVALHNLTLVDTRQYGHVWLTFLRRNPPADWRHGL